MSADYKQRKETDMTKAHHDPHGLAQWLLSLDGDLSNLAGRELERALARAEKAEASLDSIAKGEPTPMRMESISNHPNVRTLTTTAWNDAIEAALLIAGGFAGVDCNPEMVEAISILKKGEPT